jgi:3-oxoadipate enol-lactonase
VQLAASFRIEGDTTAAPEPVRIIMRRLLRRITLTRTRTARSGPLSITYNVYDPLLVRRPWLLLVQGLGFDRLGWDPVLPGLRQRFRVVTMDNRGTGRSDAAERVFAVPDLARDAVAVLDAAGLARVHVLGVSLGGMIAQELAINHPDRVDDLVLCCTTPGWPSGYPMPSASLRLMATTRNLSAETALRRAVENALSEQSVAERPELVEQLVRHEHKHRVEPAAATALAGAGARYYGGGRQSRIQARTLILQGTADRVVDQRNARLLSERIPRATLELLPGLGHLFFWESPDALITPVTRFLRGQATTVREETAAEKSAEKR